MFFICDIKKYASLSPIDVDAPKLTLYIEYEAVDTNSYLQASNSI